MHTNNVIENNHRSLASIATDLKDEISEFIETRIALLKAELRGELRAVRNAAPMAAAGIMLAGTAYLLFTLALVALFASLIPTSAFRWFIAFMGVGILWSLVAGIFLYVAKRRMATSNLIPQKTIEVLRNDKAWLQQKARNEI
jgi:uncharacterized membrane protein YqjE